MARLRRKTSAAMRWNLEIAGILALGFALLLGIALVAPAGRTGVIGGGIAFALHALFGVAAGLFVVLIALVAAIVFLEINVPKMIATLGGAACAYFIAIDIGLAASGHEGGLLGDALDRALRALLGDPGVWIVVFVGVLAVTVGITGVSLKRVIGWCAARLAALRPAASPRSLREAFHFPALPGRTATIVAPAELPAPARTVTSPSGGMRRSRSKRAMRSFTVSTIGLWRIWPPCACLSRAPITFNLCRPPGFRGSWPCSGATA